MSHAARFTLSVLLVFACCWATVALAEVSGADDAFFPQFHVRPEAHWINDPNGPMYDPRHDKYHLWMQYNPDDNVWGNISWYHTISDDLVYFRRLGVSLYNDEPYDIGGVFSGSATLVEGGSPSPVLSYTCTNATKAQKQCAAIPDDENDPELLSWRKVTGNPLIESGPPPQNSFINFRDPTEGWRLPNGTYRQAFGTSLLPDVAAVALYDSPTLTENLTFAGLLMTTTSFVDPMFECPNYFSLHNVSNAVGPQRYALKVSDMESWTDYFFVGLDSGDGVGQRQTFDFTCYNGVANCPSQPGPGELNARIVDFGKWYASTTFWDAKKARRVMWGWINEDWPEYNLTQSWAGAQSIPRLVGYDPLQRMVTLEPIPEMAALRRGSVVRGTANGSVMANVTLSPDPAAPPVWLTTANGLPEAGASAVAGAMKPQMEIIANFSISKSLLQLNGLSQIDVGLAVMHDGHAVLRGDNGTAAFVGVSVTADGATPADGALWVNGTYWKGPSGDAQSTQSEQVSGCAQLCVRDKRCIAWTFNTTEPVKPCALKAKFTGNAPESDPDFISGRPASEPVFGVFREDSGTIGSPFPHIGRAGLVELDADRYQLSLRVFVDHSVVEAFKDGGLERVASRVYNDNATSLASAVYRVRGVTPSAALAAGSVQLVAVEAWNLGSIWEKPAPPQGSRASGLAAVLIAACFVGVTIAILSVFAVRKRREEVRLLESNERVNAYSDVSNA